MITEERKHQLKNYNQRHALIERLILSVLKLELISNFTPKELERLEQSLERLTSLVAKAKDALRD